jgi:hypothetical protein
MPFREITRMIESRPRNTHVHSAGKMLILQFKTRWYLQHAAHRGLAQYAETKHAG